MSVVKRRCFKKVREFDNYFQNTILSLQSAVLSLQSSVLSPQSSVFSLQSGVCPPSSLPKQCGVMDILIVVLVNKQTTAILNGFDNGPDLVGRE